MLKVKLMGVINLTTDSFYNKSRFQPSTILDTVQQMTADGADIIDVGAESSRPGAVPLTLADELARLEPIFKAIPDIQVPVSIDTYKPAVALQALKSGARIINDITGLRNPEMVAICAEYKAQVVIMHMQGTPQTMQAQPVYQDVVAEICAFFERQIRVAQSAGITEIILDPGIGFGKTTAHNLEILNNIPRFKALGFPVLIGASRKRLIADIYGAEKVEDRLPGTLQIHLRAAQKGADILRVHDVAEHRQMLAAF